MDRSTLDVTCSIGRPLGRCILFVSLLILSSCQPQDSSTTSCNCDAEGDQSSESPGLTKKRTRDSVDAIEIVESPATGVALGWGWNRGDSEPVPTICVEFVPGEEPAQTRYMTMSEVNDSYEMMKSLGVSAEASVKTIGYEVKGKASFAKSQNISSSKSTFVLNAVVQNGVRYTSPAPVAGSVSSKYQAEVGERGGSNGSVRLTSSAVKAIQKSEDAFRNMCGSSFVSAIYGGAKLTAALSFSTSSKKEKETIKAQMSGSGWGARFEGEVNSSSTSGKKSERMDVSIFMTGGKGGAIPASKEDLLAKLKTISMDAYTAPKDFQIAITPYELLSNWPNETPLPDKESEFEQLASYWGAYNTIYDEVQQVLDAPERFVALPAGINGKTAEQFCLAERKIFIKAQKNYNVDLAAAIKGKVGAKLKAAMTKVSNNLNAKEKAFNDCVAKPQAGKKFSPPDLQKLKRAQDEVLFSLKRMEIEARVCSDKSDTCNFEPSTYRSPYAFRIQLPVLVDSELSSFDELIDYKIGRLAKRRCDLSANDTACLSNAEISRWSQKQGMQSVNVNIRKELFNETLSTLKEVVNEPIAAGQYSLENYNSKLDSQEQAKQVLWYNSLPVPIPDEG